MKTALITGASQGIGAAVADKLNDKKIIKIYPIKSKASSIDILNFKSIDFIAAGGLSINDVKTYKSLGYKAIVIGNKGIIKKKFDPKIFEWLKNN